MEHPQLDHKHIDAIQGESRSVQTDLLAIIAHLLVDVNFKLTQQIKQNDARAKRTDDVFVKAMPLLDTIGAYFLSQMGPMGPSA